MALELPLTAAAAFACALVALPGRRTRPAGSRGARLLARAGCHPWVRAALSAPPVADGSAALVEGLVDRGLAPSAAAARGLLAAAGPACALSALLVSLEPAAVPLGCAAGWSAVAAAAVRAGRERAAQTARGVPDAYRSLASGLASGQTMAQAVAYVGRHGRGAVAEAFRAASFELDCGASVERAVKVAAAGVDDASMGLLSCALTVSQRTGAPMADLLERSAELVEEREGLRGSLRAKTAQARMSAAVVMTLPVVLVALLALISPDFRAGAATPLGAGCLAAAVLVDAAALWIMARIMGSVRP